LLLRVNKNFLFSSHFPATPATIFVAVEAMRSAEGYEVRREGYKKEIRVIVLIRFGVTIETILEFPLLAKVGLGGIWSQAQIVSSETTNRIMTALSPLLKEGTSVTLIPQSRGIPLFSCPAYRGSSSPKAIFKSLDCFLKLA
jgi:hypothetical protein